jgi:hypothetical protein
MRVRIVSTLPAGLLAFASVASFAASIFAKEASSDDPASDKAENAEPETGSDSGSDGRHDNDSGADEPSPEDVEKPAAAGEANVEATVKLGAAPARFARFWVGVAGSLDLAVVGGLNDVCKLGSLALPLASSAGYCTTPYGDDFPSRSVPTENDALIPGRAGTLEGGMKLGNIRILLAADYAVTTAVLVGLRIGYVANAYPGDAAVSGRPDFMRHLHAEVRGTYVFGRDALMKVGFSPMAFFGAGAATTDAHDKTSVSLAGVRGTTPVNAWQIGGPFFATLGGGARYGFSSRAAFTASWKASLAFGSPGPLFTTGPELGFQYGF